MHCPACGHDNIDGIDTCDECLADLRSEDRATPRSAVENKIIEMPVSSLVARQPSRLPATTTLRDAIQKMIDDRAGCVLVVGEDGALTGILTERDVLKRIVAVDEVDLDRHNLGDYATANPETIKPSASLQVALHRMAINEFRHLPFESEPGQPDGLITARDILDFIEANFRETVTRAFRRPGARADEEE